MQHLSGQHLSRRHLSISGISQLLLTRFWPNFKVSFLGLSLTNVKMTFVQATFDLAKSVHISNMSAVTEPILIKLFWPKFFFDLNFFLLKINLDPIFFDQNFFFYQILKKYFRLKLLRPLNLFRFGLVRFGMVQGSLFFLLRGRGGWEIITKWWHLGKVYKNWCLEMQLSIIYPPNFRKKCLIFMNFCKNCPGRYLKVMKEWRSLNILVMEVIKTTIDRFLFIRSMRCIKQSVSKF